MRDSTLVVAHTEVPIGPHVYPLILVGPVWLVVRVIVGHRGMG